MNNKHVVHVTHDMSQVSGGVPAVVTQLSDKQSSFGMNVKVVHATSGTEKTSEKIESMAFPSSGISSVWSWSKELGLGVDRLVAQLEKKQAIFHIHGVWSAPQYICANAAHAASFPFILSVHGMLEPWLWNNQGTLTRLKKKLYWKGFGYNALQKANIIHAITPLEEEHLAKLFPKSRIKVIPNAIEIDESCVHVSGSRKKSILFLGRIEPNKGVDILLAAYGKANLGNDWKVDIVGPVWSEAYMVKLKQIIDKYEINDHVVFHDSVFGKRKDDFLDNAWVMAVPSQSEVVGLVNLEASARYLPTITTHQTGLYDWEDGGGILIEPTIRSLATALKYACSWSEQEQFDRGELSRSLVESRYSWNEVFPQWISLYQDVWDRG